MPCKKKPAPACGAADPKKPAPACGTADPKKKKK